MQDIKFIKVIISVVITMALFQHTSIYDSANCLRDYNTITIFHPSTIRSLTRHVSPPLKVEGQMW